MNPKRKQIADARASPAKEDRAYRTHPAFAEDRRRDEIRRLRHPLEKRLILLQLGVFGVVFLLWPLPIINPIKLMVVVFHELSHVFTAYLTGGTVFGIAIDPGGAGVTLGLGGNEVLIVAAGYMGSLAIGAALYALCATWDPNEVWGVVSGFTCLSLAFGWLNDFTVVFGYGTLILIVISMFVLSEEVKKFLLRLVATTSCLYPVIDVAGDLLVGPRGGFLVRGEVVGSDFAVLARMTGVPEAAIAVPSILFGVAAVLLLIAWSARKEATVEVKRSLFRRGKKKRRLGGLYDPDDTSTIPEYVVR